jgi:SpoIIAA-like
MHLSPLFDRIYPEGGHAMAVDIYERADGRVLVVRAIGKLTNEDYHYFIPEVERLIDRHGTIRLLFDMVDFHGWTASALWHDVQFDFFHFQDIERLAMFGNKIWERGMATFCRPFTTAKIRYFEMNQVIEAVAWIEDDLEMAHAGASEAQNEEDVFI